MQRQSLEEYRGKVVHFIGIGGSSMSGLALLLRGAGCVVRGDDRSESHATHKLRQAGIPVTIGHDAQNVRGADLVVSTAAICAARFILPGAALIFFRPSAVKGTVTVCPLVATW